MRMNLVISSISLLLAACQAPSGGPQSASSGHRAGGSDLAGVVTSANGPEAGVWVIAETSDLPTKFAKIVVTDDRGRYLIPELPKANYSVWVRGYGLVDSPKLQAAPGKVLDLTAVVAPDRKSTRLNSSHLVISYAVFCLKKKKKQQTHNLGGGGIQAPHRSRTADLARKARYRSTRQLVG